MGKSKQKEPRLFTDAAKDKAFKKRFNIKGDYQHLTKIKQYNSLLERLG